MKKRWPDLFGATVENGWVCIGRKGEGTYVLIQRAGEPHAVLDYRQARRIQWEHTRANNAILAEALLGLINSKLAKQGKGVYDRGMVCAQVTATGRGPTTLYLYEAGYRGAMFPRYFWPLPGVPLDGYGPALWAAICAEVASKEIVGKEDRRGAACVEGEP